MVPVMEPLSDEELISRWRGQSDSFEAERWLTELFQRRHARVALWCLRLTGDRRPCMCGWRVTATCCRKRTAWSIEMLLAYLGFGWTDSIELSGVVNNPRQFVK